MTSHWGALHCLRGLDRNYQRLQAQVEMSDHWALTQLRGRYNINVFNNISSRHKIFLAVYSSLTPEMQKDGNLAKRESGDKTDKQGSPTFPFLHATQAE